MGAIPARSLTALTPGSARAPSARQAPAWAPLVALNACAPLGSPTTAPALSGAVEVGGRRDELAVHALVVLLFVVVSKIVADGGASIVLTGIRSGRGSCVGGRNEHCGDAERGLARARRRGQEAGGRAVAEGIEPERAVVRPWAPGSALPRGGARAVAGQGSRADAAILRGGALDPVVGAIDLEERAATP